MTKEELKNRVEELDVLIKEANGNVASLVNEQKTFTKKLEDLDKPKLSAMQFDDIQHIVESACEAFHIDPGDCEYNLEINYDNQVEVVDFDWSRIQEDLVQNMMDRMEEVFAVEENDEE